MKQKMRIAALLCGLFLLCGLCACGQEKADPADDPSAPVSSAVESDAPTVSGEESDLPPEDVSGDPDITDPDNTTTKAGDNVNTTDNTTAPGQKNTTKKPGTTTTTTAKKTTTTTGKKDPSEFDWHSYNVDCFIYPVWEGKTVYNEALMFVPDAKTGKIEPAPLLYKPDKVLEVRSADLSKLYKEGADYTVTADGRIQLTEKSRIYSWNYDDYYRKTPDSFDILSLAASGRHLRYAEGNTFTKTQVSVTYTHSDKWSGPVPEFAGNTLKNTMKKLNAGDPLNIVYNGDSVAVGCNSSGYLKIAPFVPSWTDMVTQELKAAYTSPITAINTAVGGTKADWGLENVQDNIIKHNPDLVILRFGVNDGTANVPTDTFKSQMDQIIQKVRAANPACEFILVSNLCPNPDANGWTTKYHREYEAAEEELAAKYTGVAVAKMTTMETHLLKYKRYYDTTGNNINHLNDFMARFQASVVAKLLVKDL